MQNTNSYEDIRCPICGAAGWEIIYETQASVCSGGEVVRSEDSLVKGMCSGCGFCHTLRSPLNKDLDQYYREQYSAKLRDQAFDLVNFSTGKTFGDTLNDFVMSHPFKSEGRCLDIGCGKGFFEAAMAEKYPQWAVEGVDPSVRSIDLAREIAPTAKYYTRNFTGGDYESGVYDLVALHTVLNRVPVDTFLAEARELLAPEGIMSVAIAVFPQAPFELFFADHINLYHVEHFLAVAESLGLEAFKTDLKGSINRFLLCRATVESTEARESLTRSADRIQNDVGEIVTSWRSFFTEINALKERGEQAYFYGAGTTMMIAVSQTDFPEDLVAGVFDDTPAKENMELLGQQIRKGDQLPDDGKPVILCVGGNALELVQAKVPGNRPILHL